MTERNHWWTDRWLRSPLFLPFFLWLSICLSVYLSLSLSSVYLSVCLSICKLENEAILRGFLNFLNLTTSKTKQFCETSSIFELNNVKNARLLQFWTWQHQKQSKSTRLPSKMESWVQRWQPRTNPFCNFSTPPV